MKVFLTQNLNLTSWSFGLENGECYNGITGGDTKVERSHLTDKQEFYQLLEYTDDIDIGKKLKEWESFYNHSRPNGALNGKTPYEVLREKLKSQ